MTKKDEGAVGKKSSEFLDITIIQAKQIVKKIIVSDTVHAPIFLHSSPGIGKSSILAQIAQELNMKYIDTRLSTMEASDVCGIPYVDTNNNMRYSIPPWFPTDPKVKAILNFDEISNAMTSVQHAAYRVIWDRSLQQDIDLPAGVKITACGNLTSDRTGARPILPALANRFATHLKIKPDVDSFVAYAIEQNMNSKIIGFLMFNATALYRAPNNPEDISFPSPRTWENAARILDMHFNREELTHVLAGCLGRGTAVEFLAHEKYYSQLPNFDQIALQGVDYTIPKDQMDLDYAITSNLILAFYKYIDSDRAIQNLGKVMAQLADEYVFLIFRTLKNMVTMEDKRIVRFTQHLKPHFERISKYVVQPITTT